MGLFDKLAKSADLMNGMADRLGADLAAAVMRDPEIEAVRYRTMVRRCAGCDNQDGCAELQADHDRLGTAPNYCRNKSVLEALSRG